MLALEFTVPGSLKKKDHLILMFPINGFNALRTVNIVVKNIPNNFYQNVSLIALDVIRFGLMMGHH